MSMNLHLSAKVEATLSNGEKRIIAEYFELWQTPTNTTYAILEAADVKEAYAKWARDTDVDNYSASHLANLDRWLAEYAGWEIEWFAL